MKKLLFALALLSQVYHKSVEAFNVNSLWRRAEQEHITKEYQIDTGSAIVITNTDGSITIKPWDQQKIMIEATKKGSAEELKATTLSCKSFGSDATITTRVAQDQKSAAVDYTIMVPEETKIRIVQTKGPVKIKGVRGNLDVSVQDGEIDIIDATNIVTAKTGKGDIKIQQKKFGPKESLFVETLKGTITLHLPRETQAQLHAKTGAGSITSDHPVTLAPITVKLNKDGWDRLKKDVEGTLGGGKGGAPITLETSKGNILIKEY